MFPVTASLSSGVSIVTSPSREESGQDGALLLLSAICAELQAPRPSADAGLTRTPVGNVTTAFLRSDWLMALGSSVWGMVKSNVNAAGVPAFTPATGWPLSTGSNGTPSQPSGPCCGPQSNGANGYPGSRWLTNDACTKIPGCCHESALIVAVNPAPGAVHDVGL